MCVQAGILRCHLFFLCAISTAADDFLARQSLASIAEQVNPDLLHKLIGDVEDALGVSLHNDTHRQLLELETILRPTYKALPRNKMGKLDHSTARYALHRFFAQRNGWVIRGFQSEAMLEAPNASSASQLLEGRVPSLVQEIFEERIGQDGWSLTDVAVFAVLLEHLVNEEIVVKLERVYKVQDLPITTAITPERALATVELYMMLYIQGHADVTLFEKEKIAKFMANFHIIYPPWHETRQMLKEIHGEVGIGMQKFSFRDVVHVLREAVRHYFERVHRDRCQQAKNLLLEFEEHGSGRVKLLDFYNKAIHEHRYEFTETIEFLRQSGALDESDPLVPRVIIPNYVAGQGNCVARSDYYAVCCPDDCESRFDELEQRLGKPYATPGEILDLQEFLAESGQISTLLVSRLNDIADYHEGVVPLHGRLFAQWMHFVHPQACMYPYLTGAVYTKTMEEWEEETGLRTGSTMEEIHTWSRSLADQESQQSATMEQGLSISIGHDMWTMDEELIAERKTANLEWELPSFDVDRAAIIRILVFVFVFASTIVFLATNSGAEGAMKSLQFTKNQKKHYV